MVKDWQTMKAGSSKWAGKGWPKREYYKAWNPKDMKKYTPFDAAEKFRQTKYSIRKNIQNFIVL